MELSTNGGGRACACAIVGESKDAVGEWLCGISIHDVVCDCLSSGIESSRDSFLCFGGQIIIGEASV